MKMYGIVPRHLPEGAGMPSLRRLNTLFFCLCTVLFCSAFAQSGVSTEGPYTVLRTGGSSPLITFESPLGLISTNADLLLEFDFGFATSEPPSPGTFFDSFSLTLQNSASQSNALLLTADRDAVRWAPNNPGGIDLSNEDLRHQAIAFPNLSPTHVIRFAFHVVLAIPRGLTGGPLMLFADLFDNANSNQSLAFISGVTVRENSVPLRVQSVSEAAGQFQDEIPLAITQDSITVPNTEGKRFYRFVALRPTRIIEQRVFSDRVILDYRYEPLTGLRLQGASALGGSFADIENAVWNPTNRTFTVSRVAGFDFFRVVGDHLALVRSVSTVGDDIVIEYLSALIELRSAPTASRVTSMVSRSPDQTRRIFRVNPNKPSEIFQIRSDLRTRISLTREGPELVIAYEVIP